MATITTISAFQVGDGYVAGTWNNKYDLLYNTLNGGLDNVNFVAGAAITEDKLIFSPTGHDHSSSGGKIPLASFATGVATKGLIQYFNGTTWAWLGTGGEGTSLTLDFDTYVKMLLHLDNAETDACSTPKTMTPVNMTYSSTTAMFGGYSGVFNGSSSYITANWNADFEFGSGNFTIDFWVNFASLSTNQDILRMFKDGSNYWLVRYATGSPGSLEMYSFGGSASLQLINSWSPTAGIWYHVAIVRNGNVFTQYVNGSPLSGTLTDAGTWVAPGTPTKLYIGSDSGAEEPLNGYLDELRISKGVARWTGAFSVPTVGYSPDIQWL